MSHLIESSILLVLFSLIYFAIKDKSNFRFLRSYIGLALLTSFGIPFIPQFSSLNLDYYSIIIPELLVSAQTELPLNQNSVQPYSIFSILKYLAIIISIGFLAKFLFSIIKIWLIIKNSAITKKSNYTIARSNQVSDPCSFFSYILIPSNKVYTDVQLQAIVKHEALHIKYNHSFEKILIEILRVIAWWHPSIWFFKNELTLIHEYQVDQSMVKLMNPNTYRDVLIQLVIHPPGLRLSNPLSSNIKKRLNMMNSNKSLNLLSKMLIAFVAVSATLIVHSCQDNIPEDSKKVTVIESNDNENNNIHSYSTTDTIVSFDVETKTEEVKYVTAQRKALKKVERMPEFPGCGTVSDAEERANCSKQKMLEYIYKNIKYPTEAKNQAIEGTVVLQFVVTKTGQLEDINIVREVEGGCSEEAFSIVERMANLTEKWNPGMDQGKAVDVLYTLPIKFKLQ